MKHDICLKDYRLQSCLSIWHAHGDLCKHLGIDSSTDLDDRYSNPDRYSNLFLNAYINSHAHTEYLNMIEVYSPLGIYVMFLCPQRNFGRHIVIALSVRVSVRVSVPLRVRCISPIFFEVGIPNLVCGCILG